MTTLQQTLQATSLRLLQIIGRRRGLRFDSSIRKAVLIEQLNRTLPDRRNLETYVAALTEREQQALDDLLRQPTPVPLRHMSRKFGSVLLQTDLIKKINQTRGPLSTLERLLALGLVFYRPAEATLVIPVEVRLPLSRLRSISEPLPASAVQLERSPLAVLCHDLTWLLALLQRDPVNLRHGRWLPPTFLAAWGQHCLVPPAAPRARSELQTGRRRFLHYLAESAGFVIGHWSLVTGHSSSGGRQRRVDQSRKISPAPLPPRTHMRQLKASASDGPP